MTVTVNVAQVRPAIVIVNGHLDRVRAVIRIRMRPAIVPLDGVRVRR